MLAAEVARLEPDDPVVLALPRGGVPVAAEVARVLNAPLDLVVVRKVGAPGNPELAIAAINDLLARPANDFDQAARYVLEKNRELYRRLS